MQAEAIDCRIVKAGQGDGGGDVHGGYPAQQRTQRAGLIATDFRDVMKDDFASGARIEERHVNEAIVNRPYGRELRSSVHATPRSGTGEGADRRRPRCS
jgi:hypothetical protein